MVNVFFDNPPAQSGSTEAQLVQLYAYLMTISSKLNEAMNSLGEEQAETQEQTQAVIRQAEEKTENNRQDLKSLIIKTAEVVRTEMEEIRTHLQGQVTAISEDFGEFQQTLDTTISATARGVLQEYNIEERITGAEQATQTFINRISQYIYTGLLDSGEVGIAIGTNVTDSSTGELIPANKMATFTSSELAFYQNGEKVAYFSGNSFVIERGEVKKSMKMGNFTWMIFDNGSMGLMKT